MLYHVKSINIAGCHTRILAAKIVSVPVPYVKCALCIALGDRMSDYQLERRRRLDLPSSRVWGKFGDLFFKIIVVDAFWAARLRRGRTCV